MVSDFRFFTLIGLRRVDLILEMLKKFFGSHVEKFLSRFEVSADHLFRNVKFEKVYPPTNPQFLTDAFQIFAGWRRNKNEGKVLSDF